MTINWLAVNMSLLAGVSTGFGALPIFLTRDFSKQQLDVGMGFSAGIMLVAAFISLLLPSLESSLAVYGGALGAFPSLLGLFLGYGAIIAIHNHLPHTHLLKANNGPSHSGLKRTTLIVLAICLHNLPEGLAVGVGFGTGDDSKGLTLAIAIAMQNMPEGLVVALGLMSIGQSKRKAFWLAMASGMIEPVAALFGYIFAQVTLLGLPIALSFAGGAMLFVTCQEMFPELFREGHERSATLGVLIGVATMMCLQFYTS